jgi:hypothetical protein
VASSPVLKRTRVEAAAAWLGSASDVVITTVTPFGSNVARNPHALFCFFAGA